jgi:glyoxalase family protein
MKLKGIHHVTAITSSAEKIYQFFTNILSLRLVKKTVNQDDINTYHLFFADDLGSPGTDMTFFDFKGIGKASHGNDQITRTSFRVPNDEALVYWLKRFKQYQVKNSGIETLFKRKLINFEDFDGQLYALISDQNNRGVSSGIPWKNGPVPDEFAITGLGPIFLTVSNFTRLKVSLEEVFFMKYQGQEDNHHLFEMGAGGNGGSVILTTSDLTRGTQGYGGIHHVAFRVADREALDYWLERLNSLNLINSGFIDRFYFASLYTRVYPNILFELATDGPGFIDDEESYETLGETLALPPKLRQYRSEIEKVVKPLDTKRSNMVFKKEYL